MWGAEPVAAGHWDVRLWAPSIETIQLRVADKVWPMESCGDGWFAIEVESDEGVPYAFVLPDGLTVPDPAARQQSGDVHSPSVLTAPSRAELGGWTGRPWEEAVIYELHVGTFTAEGSFRAAIARLDHIVSTGFTVVELMPIAHFAGNRGWGYDGVLPYCPHPAYGRPDDLRALIRAAHDRGLMVILDVVYNHFGPEGNYLPGYAADFFHQDRHTPWGPGIAFERHPVRRFFIENALYWLEEFGFDGLRFDAVDYMPDPSDTEILLELADEIRRACPDRYVHTMTEDARNITYLHERENGKVRRHTAEWNDDFHNAAHVIATGETDTYYADYAHREWLLFGRSLAEGFAYQGEPARDGRPRGSPSADLPPVAFIDFLQNHDQVGNRAFGERLDALVPEATVDALTAILLLSPHIPLMFMGEEYGAARPFCFFADFGGELSHSIANGRRQKFAEFSAFEASDLGKIPDPVDSATFERSRLDWHEAESAVGRRKLHFVSNLLHLRQRWIVPLLKGVGGRGNNGKLLTADNGSIAVDWRFGDRLLQLRARLREGGPELPLAQGEEIHAVRGNSGTLFVAHWLKTTS